MRKSRKSPTQKLKLVARDGSLLELPAALKRRSVHRKQVISSQVLSFRLRALDNSRPSALWDAPASLPLLDGPMTFIDGNSHLGDCVPAGKNLVNLFHAPLIARDDLSRQAVPMIPVTARMLKGTISPMGKGTTPASFKRDLALLLRSARVAAGYSTMEEFAKAMRVSLERYKKWESGRTAIPHEYIPLACQLLNQDANYFFKVEPKAMRKSA